MGKWLGIGDWTRGLLVRIREDRGQVLGEYSLILVFIAGACIVALAGLGLVLASQ